MKRYFFLLTFVILSLPFLAQTKTPANKLNSGDVIHENINYYKDSSTKANYILPNNAFTLLYRFNDLKGNNDNFDSMRLVMNNVFRLNRYFGPRRKPSRLTCCVIVNEINDDECRRIKNQIKTWSYEISDSLVKTNRVGFNFNRPWEILFVKASDIGKGSILTAEKLSIIAADGELLTTSSIKNFNFNGKKGSVKGKLLTEKQGKKLPVVGAQVSMIKVGNGIALDSALSDAYGDFEMGVPDAKSDYVIVVKSVAQELDNVILATQSGQEISKLIRSSRGFEYKLIPEEIVRLTEMDVNEDITLTFNKFKNKGDNELKVTENILYALGQFKIEEASKPVLNKVVKILKENPKVKLEVISHTDAQGEDGSNMTLSDKRSNAVINYFISKGIEKTRLKAIGKGENEIRNRCTNDVECSDKEHEYNRRTEFKFSKG